MSDERMLIGVATPQANPTVEIEFQRYLRGPAYPLFTRLTSNADATSERLVEYLEQIPAAVATFDTLPLQLFAFACTGSCYLVGIESEEAICDEAFRKLRVPVVTATQAIRRELQGRGAQRVALVAPYPRDLCDAAVAYWQQLGIDVVALQRIDIGDDTRRIYDLDDATVAAALSEFDGKDADVVLLSGTGMPTIAALRAASRPVISSNLCLATEALRRVHLWPPNEATDVETLLRGKA